MLHAMASETTRDRTQDHGRAAVSPRPATEFGLVPPYTGNQALRRAATPALRASRTPLLQRRCACGATTGAFDECAACQRKHADQLHRLAGDEPAPEAVPPIVHQELGSPGQPLEEHTRTFMEQRFGHDFSNVRIHTGPRAAASARSVSALAYTVGRDIVFGRGQYATGTPAGRHLLAHELAHVVQQDGQFAQRPTQISRESDPAEAEADRAADRALAGAPTAVKNGGFATLQRYSHQDCSDSDLRTHIWPADGIARDMTKKAIRVLGMSPVPAAVTPLFSRYFMTATPTVTDMLVVYNKIDAEYTKNDYQYECEDDCDETELGYTYALFSDIHLCMNHLRGKANDCIARTMVHEMSHYYAGTDDNGYCKSSCAFSSCPTSLSAADALDNADSYACFAYELNSLSV